MYLVAAAINANGDTSDMPSMQPTQHPRTSPPGLRVPEHMPRRSSCVCLPEFLSPEQMRLALSKLEKNLLRLHSLVGSVAKTRYQACLLYTSPSPRDLSTSRMPSSAAAASYSREQRAAACGVRHNIQTGLKWSGNKKRFRADQNTRKFRPTQIVPA